MNEYIHDATDAQLKGIVVQVTGAEPSSSTVKGIIGSFKALKAYATFGPEPESEEAIMGDEGATTTVREPGTAAGVSGAGIKLGYTINLNLPATSDIAVFDAIFKSLREHLL